MASTGDVFELHAGETVRIVTSSQDSQGELLELDAQWRPARGKPPVHLHPFQAERFEIQEGELTVRLGGVIHTLRAGDALDIPAGVIFRAFPDEFRLAMPAFVRRPAIAGLAFIGRLRGCRLSPAAAAG